MKAVGKADLHQHEPFRVLITGASFDTANMGVSALAAGAIKGTISRFPDASVSLLDYGKEAKAYVVQLREREVSVPLINIRFSKKLYLSNNIALLILISLLLKLVPSKRLRKWLIGTNTCLHELDRANVIVAISGGDSFSDIYGFSRLLYISLPQILVLLMGYKLVLLPQTIGPFQGKLAKAIARYILRGAERVYSRDRQGLEEIRRLLGNSKSALKSSFCYDVGFIVDAIEPHNFEIIGLTTKDEIASDLVGLNISGLLWMGGYSRTNMFGLKCDYKELIHRLIECLIDQLGVKTLLVPHVFGSDPHSESDAIACREVFAEFKEKYEGRLGIVEGTLDQSGIKYVIGSCDFFIGSRMHACIAALSQGVPAVSLAYSDKFIGVMQTLGVENLVLDPRILSAQEIETAVISVYKNRALVRRELGNKLPEVRESIFSLFSVLKRPETVPACCS